MLDSSLQSLPAPDPDDPESGIPVSSAPRLGPLGDSPESSDAHWQPLAPESVTVERIAGWIAAFALLVPGGIALAAFFLVVGPSGGWFWLPIAGYGVIAVVLIWAAQFLPGIAYRYTYYQLSDVGFEIRRGILWRSLITVPHTRVQHTDVAQGPLERSYDLGKLIVYTAGTQNASVELAGLAFQTACELRDALVRRREATDGV